MGASGTTSVDFGAFPGKSDASVAVAAPTILAGSIVEAWLIPTATVDHSADEHLVEQIRVIAGPAVAGVGFTIYALCTAVQGRMDVDVRKGQLGSGVGNALLYGLWTVGWVWN